MSIAATRRPSFLFRALIIFLWLGPPFGISALAQNSPPAASERAFHASPDQVRKVVQELHASSSGRLPTLEGFVDEPSVSGNVSGSAPRNDSGISLDRYERGFYQCVVQVLPGARGGAAVRVTAKITAWYADPNASHAGYKTLISNGRLEADFLDRLAEALGGAAGGTSSEATAEPSRVTTATRNRSRAGANAGGGPSGTNGASAAPGKSANASRAAASRPTPVSPAASPDAAASPSTSANATLDLATLRQRREAAERQMQELSSNLRSLQEIQQNQAHPNDLASVKRAGTPVFAKPESNADVLMHANAQDEFQILGAEAQWVHVQISGASRGWIKRSAVEMPGGFEPSARNISTAPVAAEPFRVTREDTGAFPGDWKPLAGKMVRIVWVTPTGSSSAIEKRAFAKSILIARAQSTADAAGIAGVVVIFDSADGGQVAATLDSIQKLDNGALREDAFWKSCSLDPPESFQQTSPSDMPQ